MRSSADNLPRLGATPLGDGRTRFVVWAPRAQRVELHVVEPGERFAPLEPVGDGYFRGEIDGAPPGTLYYYRLDQRQDRPDPASRSQPRGVHGPSAVTEVDFPWRDATWQGLALAELALYELHVGAFSSEGTFAGVERRLDELVDLGVTAIELMPVGQFPGRRNWGYDGAFPYAVQQSYGGADGLKRLADAAHARRMAVILDVVYNHLGPEGNYLADFGPYFNDARHTAWGAAVNLDGVDALPVRRYFIDNALEWIADYHLDGLRLDAIHAIEDHSRLHFLAELSQAVGRLGERLHRRIHLIAESNLNDPLVVRPVSRGGYGLGGQTLDDFSYALLALLTGERHGHFADFGKIADLAQAWREGFVLTGQYSHYRKRPHGKSGREISPRSLVVCSQNHDLVGNRPGGERLSRLAAHAALVDADATHEPGATVGRPVSRPHGQAASGVRDASINKLAAAATILSPYLPMLFMGEEWGEENPFLFFTDYHDPDLGVRVAEGRRQGFAHNGHIGDSPDPQAEETFLRSRLNHDAATREPGSVVRRYYQALFRLRRVLAANRAERPAWGEEVRSWEDPPLMVWNDGEEDRRFSLILHFGKSDCAVSAKELTRLAPAYCLFDSADAAWGGPRRDSLLDRQLAGSVTLAAASCLVLAAKGALP